MEIGFLQEELQSYIKEIIQIHHSRWWLEEVTTWLEMLDLAILMQV